jgi:hypothetical protein
MRVCRSASHGVVLLFDVLEMPGPDREVLLTGIAASSPGQVIQCGSGRCGRGSIHGRPLGNRAKGSRSDLATDLSFPDRASG